MRQSCFYHSLVIVKLSSLSINIGNSAESMSWALGLTWLGPTVVRHVSSNGMRSFGRSQAASVRLLAVGPLGMLSRPESSFLVVVGH